MGPSKVRRFAFLVLLLNLLSLPGALAQEGIGEDGAEAPSSEVDKSAAKSDKPAEPPKHVYSLEVLSVRDYKTVALLQKQLENLLERGAVMMKTKATWGQLIYEVRSTMSSNDIKNGLMQMQLEEAKLKSVSFANNRFTVEVQ